MQSESSWRTLLSGGMAGLLTACALLVPAPSPAAAEGDIDSDEQFGAWAQAARITASDAASLAWFGQSVAVGGDTAVVGAYGHDCGTGLFCGSAYVYMRNQGGADNWGEVKKLAASDAESHHYFARSLAISGDTIVVGAYSDDDACPGDPDCDSGAAYVFERNHGGADNWGETKKLTASDAAALAFFGVSVAIAGDTLVVGAAPDGGGAVYVFERNHGGADNWGETHKLTPLDGSSGEGFGVTLAINGDTLVAGARNDGDSGSSAGAAYVFERNSGGANNWGEVQKLIASDAESNDWFGNSVAVDGDRVVIGAPYENDAGDHAGAAYLFERNRGGADNWGEVRKLTGSESSDDSNFGRSVDVSGGRIAVGAPGSTYLFERNRGGADNWGEVGRLTGADNAYMFGAAVAIDGATVVAGAFADDHAGHMSGSAFVFAASDCDWVEQAKPVAPDAALHDTFGVSVSIDHDTLVVGSPWDNGAASDAGSAYLFRRNLGGADNWGELLEISASDAAADDEFGVCVALSGSTLVVGSRFDDDAGNGSGSAYVFERNHGGPDNWGEIKKLTGSSAAPGDWFGYGCAINGDTVVVGSPDYHGGFGSAYVFERNRGGANNWGEVKEITPSDTVMGDTFGISMGIDGDTLVVGAPGFGSAYVFERDRGGVDNWGEVEKITASDGSPGSSFGLSASVSGDTVVVGAHLVDSAYVFERNRGGADNWGEVKKLTDSDPAIDDFFGFSVFISGDRIVVGTMNDDYAGFFTGSAYVFERNRGGADNWGMRQKLERSDASSPSRFGRSVSMSGDTLAVGADWDSVAIAQSGGSYVFKVFSTKPEVVQGVVVEGKNLTTVSWIDQGPGVGYDVASGLLSGLQAGDGVAAAQCLEDDAPVASCDDVRTNPAPGDGYYYIIRSQHACTGTYGYGSTGEERMPESDCP